MENQQTTKPAINLGLILGFCLALITVYGYSFDSSIYFSIPFLILILLLPLVFGIISTIKTKKETGFLSFRDSLKSYVITVAIGFLISTLVQVLIFNVVDPDFKDVVKKVQMDGLEKQKDRTIGKMYNNGTPEKTIENVEKSFDKSLEKMDKKDQFSIINSFKSFLMMLGVYSIIGLLVAAIVKKKNPDEI